MVSLYSMTISGRGSVDSLDAALIELLAAEPQLTLVLSGDVLGVDPTLVRLAFAVFTIFGGAGILIYLIAWIVIPEEGGDGSSIAESFVSKRRS